MSHHERSKQKRYFKQLSHFRLQTGALHFQKHRCQKKKKKKKETLMPRKPEGCCEGQDL